MKRRLRTLLLLLLIATRTLLAQNSHFASSSSPDSLSPDEETDFITTHFPLKQLCKWTPGMKFMFIPDSSDEFVPILCKYEDGKEVVKRWNIPVRKKLYMKRISARFILPDSYSSVKIINTIMR